MPTVTVSDDEKRWLEEAAKERGLPSAALMVSALINDARTDQWWAGLDEDQRRQVRAKIDRGLDQIDRGETYSAKEAWEMIQARIGAAAAQR